MSDIKKPSDQDVSSVRLAASERVSSVDPRAHAAWRTWLAALAHDADAATAAALAYQSLGGDGRGARARGRRRSPRGPPGAAGARTVHRPLRTRSRRRGMTDPVNRPDLLNRCGTCARFVRVIEKIDENGEVKRHGECLLGVW